MITNLYLRTQPPIGELVRATSGTPSLIIATRARSLLPVEATARAAQQLVIAHTHFTVTPIPQLCRLPFEDWIEQALPQCAGPLNFFTIVFDAFSCYDKWDGPVKAHKTARVFCLVDVMFALLGMIPGLPGARAIGALFSFIHVFWSDCEEIHVQVFRASEPPAQALLQILYSQTAKEAWSSPEPGVHSAVQEKRAAPKSHASDHLHQLQPK